MPASPHPAAPLFLDPHQADFIADPYPALARLRAQAPVHWSPPLRAWVVTRYDDVHAILNDRHLSADTVTPFYKAQPSATQAELQSLMRYLGNWLVFRDPPDHTRIRNLTARVFTSRALAPVKANIEAITTALLADLTPRPQIAASEAPTHQPASHQPASPASQGTRLAPPSLDAPADKLASEPTIDLVARFSNPLPAYVIMDMLGVPRGLLADMKHWSDEIKLFIGSARSVPDKYARARAGVEAMAEAFRAAIERQRQTPEDNILSMLIAAHDGTDGRLSDDELIATCILFLFAGHETTTSLISMATLHLLEQLDQRRAFLELSTQAEIDAATEEFLRYDAPTPSMVRIAVSDHAIGGQTIRAGERIYAMIAAANRDPAAFERADALDVRRPPKRHYAFGYGTHFCLGAPLARLEAGIAIKALFNQFPAMTLVEPPAWADGMTLRGPTHLHVALGLAM